MSETADLLHHVPGRLRLRLPFAKRNPARLHAIRNGLAGLSGVRAVEGNAVLGTVVVQYDPALYTGFQAALETYAEQYGLFSMACEDKSTPCVSAADRSIDRTLSDVNRVVQQALGNVINLKELLPIALGLYGFLFVDKSAAAAQWLNWMQFAFDSYIDLHEGEPITELGQKLDALGTRILERQGVTAEALSRELASIRAELRELSERLPRQQESQ